jgi:ribosomal protein S21
MATELIKHINRRDPNAKLIITDGVKHKSVEALVAFGLKTCESCGQILPIEKNFCKCGEEVFIILSKEYVEPQKTADDHKFWAPEEEQQILAEVKSQYSYTLIAQIHNRTIKACREKVKRLRKNAKQNIADVQDQEID